MNIITVFATTTEGYMASTSKENYGLPWSRSADDMGFLFSIVETYKGKSKSAVMMTSSTKKSLPKKVIDHLESSYNKIIVLGNGEREISLPENSVPDIDKIVRLAGCSEVNTVLYFGSPKYLISMVGISDITYVTVFNEALKTGEHRGISPQFLGLLLGNNPKMLVKNINGGKIYKVASKRGFTSFIGNNRLGGNIEAVHANFK